MKKLRLFTNTVFHSIFWIWNLLFLAVVYLGILPYVGIPLIEATFNGDIPVDFSLTLFALIAVPTVCTFIGAKYFIKKPKTLMRLFYGVEAPFFTSCLVRLFLIRELTLASALVLGTLFICISAFTVELFAGYQYNQKVSSWVQMITHTLLLLMGIYLGMVLLFYAIPTAAVVISWMGSFLVWFFSGQWIPEFWEVLTDSSGYIFIYSFWGLLFLGLFGFTATLFMAFPFAITGLYVNSGQRILRAFTQEYGKFKTIFSSVTVISLWLILLFSFNQQPQVKAFTLLEQTPQNRQELLASSDLIRTGLVNANLYPYRYLSTTEDNNHIYSIYKNLGLPKSTASFLQYRYNQLLSPFLYVGSRNDVPKSAQLYAEFFDTPIQKAERKSVRHAIQSTSIVDQAKAGLLNIDQKKVWLEKQEVTIDPHGDWANVEIHEVYQNKTNDVEEILYYFSLPETAAITGLWLGESDNLDLRFPFQVAPRGAAQEVYNSQVQRPRPIDPALLEQVGPGQYRLRAFPVPPQLSVREIANSQSQPKMHLWLTYQVMEQEQGWALPKLAEKRNIFWTKNTERVRNGKGVKSFANYWLEDFWGDNQNATRISHQIKLEDGYTVTAQPLNKQDYSLPQNHKYALILDTSYSMRNHRTEVQATFDWWQANLTNNYLDLYLTDAEANKAQQLETIDSLELDTLIFFGSMQTQDMLQQFQNLRNGHEYDAVLLVTDEGSYELSSDNQDVMAINSPFWMIHLGGKLPRAYDDAILQTIQNSHGGVANDVPTVIKRLATEEASSSSVVDGYSWSVEKSNSANALTENKLKPLAARQLVYSLSQQDKNKLSLAKLDSIHQIAQDYDIVTPYSSMIVLVNDQQRELLKQAEAKSDRFDREVETGAEQLNTPFNPFEVPTVSGVPEPDLWILFFIVAIALLLIFQKQRSAKVID
ncbi:PEP-CTERM family integral membrane protein [Xenococcus sp. PCC 7305]|uniref:TIGR02921 family PEP-CTERM protein n=1 Tax=Xenococcus sp. PCC 7305 TaxID=102125 RepID=UPI0002ABD783|nr:TIGR02921 family PEP-CTERM protein [Xenococcus sp. PCC 7305]ELS03538.1 PEP-CTERM family integral membrane protein [Xenococcus sp. PCC 7305]